ncbi:hypothetical protein [Arenimonas sp.]|uniref:hypothetical protein n=1 Tax=Arenimonas sp. TaxID=1872635 RepID=UPI0039E6F994
MVPWDALFWIVTPLVVAWFLRDTRELCQEAAALFLSALRGESPEEYRALRGDGFTKARVLSHVFLFRERVINDNHVNKMAWYLRFQAMARIGVPALLVWLMWSGTYGRN